MGARVLLVEDEPQIREILEFYLGGEGFEVECMADGESARSLVFTAPPPDVVLLDIMLPYTSGLEVLEAIRASAAWKDVPVLMLTAREAEEDVVKAFDLGADDYVTKPFPLDELVARINRLLKTKTSRHDTAG